MVNDVVFDQLETNLYKIMVGSYGHRKHISTNIARNIYGYIRQAQYINPAISTIPEIFL